MSKNLHQGMAYLLVRINDTSEAGTYGMALSVDQSTPGQGVFNGGGLGDSIFPYLRGV